jgi:hypothetical protein
MWTIAGFGIFVAALIAMAFVSQWLILRLLR